MHLVHDRRGQLCPSAAKRVAERNGAAVDVELFGIDRQLAQAGQDLSGEGFVQLDEIHLSSVSPASFSTFRTAGTGPIPNRSGSTPAVANATNRASGRSPRVLAKSAEVTTRADAPSLV